MESAVALNKKMNTLLGISVVVPVYNDPTNLDLCLTALRSSNHPEFEILVVDDASTDKTIEVAERHGASLVRQPERQGPGAARNRGAEEAGYPLLLFIDADVCVQEDTLTKVAETFRDDPEIDALFGSYDQSPGAPNLLSQYRNLMHHYYHQEGSAEATTFWSGCGAIRRQVFVELGGFDIDYGQASIEDIELGARLRKAGHRVILVKEIQVKHMKRWTLRSIIKTDVLQRGIPWTLLLLREGQMPNDLNLKHSQRLSGLLAGGLLATLLGGSWYYRSLFLVPLVLFVGVLALDRWTRRRPIPAWARIGVGGVMLVTVAAMLVYTAMGHNLYQLWILLALSLLGSIVLLNLRFYLFFVRVKGPLFGLAVIPLHVFYFLYSGAAFAVGVGLHFWHSFVRPTETRKRV
jgi:GT2 family glycosyltransferase